MSFGEEIRQKFMFDKSISHVNHGSFGPTVEEVFDERIRLLREQELKPETWYSELSEKYYHDSLCAGAEFLGADKDNLALVDNVTTGINTVMKCLQFEEGDQILITSHTYSGVSAIVEEQRDCKGVELEVIEFSVPLHSDEDIICLYGERLRENPRIKVAVIDHITMPSAIVMPLKKIIDICREHDVITVVDGAHAPGQLEMNLEDLAADYYSGNFHKWCYATRGCGFLYIATQNRGKIRPLVTSCGYKSTLSEQFSNTGTRDMTSLFTLQTALAFYKRIGGRKAITRYVSGLLDEAAGMICEALGTEQLPVPPKMKAPMMTVVRYPVNIDHNFQATDELMMEILNKYNVQALFTPFNGSIWVRFAGNVYNTRDDYINLKTALVDYLKKDRKEG